MEKTNEKEILKGYVGKFFLVKNTKDIHVCRQVIVFDDGSVYVSSNSSEFARYWNLSDVIFETKKYDYEEKKIRL